MTMDKNKRFAVLLIVALIFTIIRNALIKDYTTVIIATVILLVGLLTTYGPRAKK